MPIVEPKWVVYAKKVDEYVDDLYGENVTLIPWKTNPYRAGEADEDREPLVAVGIPMDKTATPQGASAEFISHALESDLILSIRHEPIDTVGLRRDDRVAFEWRAETFAVTFIDEQSDDRHYVHLVIIKEPA